MLQGVTQVVSSCRGSSWESLYNLWQCTSCSHSAGTDQGNWSHYYCSCCSYYCSKYFFNRC